eukprot:CAMPEP_0182520718 /NCGR_PEP_ID=MMETSP1321-20130603/45759_1 /TAXON_ID=91990 /ORGANISM="Bolidomonas sp., Strain RCC1657" /LENGTH=45 /DNA_ID= /DNA_START= /DNA_END= /DNA_ORIENTATION=
MSVKAEKRNRTDSRKYKNAVCLIFGPDLKAESSAPTKYSSRDTAR